MFHTATAFGATIFSPRPWFPSGLCLALFLAVAYFAAEPVLAQTGSLQSTEPGTSLGSQFNQPEFLPVEEAYPLAVEPTGADSVLLVWQMPSGYYLYQHAFRFEYIRDGKTTKLEP